MNKPNPPSSNTLKITLASEFSLLEMLAGSLLSCNELPSQLTDICVSLKNQGYVKVRNVTFHGTRTFNAWDITDEGQAHLIKKYKHDLNK